MAQSSLSRASGSSVDPADVLRRKSDARSREDTLETDTQLSVQAMRFVFSARFDEAVQLLSRPSKGRKAIDASNSTIISGTHSFIAFTQALVTYETGKIQEAIDLWKHTEKVCSVSTKDNTIEDKLEKRIILADAKICATFLQLLQSADFGGLFKGGWSIRQAWKLYQGAYEDILKLIDTELKAGKLTAAQVSALTSQLPSHKSFVVNNSVDVPSPSKQNHTPTMSRSARHRKLSRQSESEDDEFHDALTDLEGSSVGDVLDGFFHSSGSANVNVQYSRLHQILGSVCYGYGCFHLMLSLLPAHLLKWLKFLGFEGDLRTGMTALTYCMNSPDSKALLARITLIWFHTIIQTYYAVHEKEMEEGITSACALLDGLDPELRNSPLISFFDCRLKRFRKDIEGAIVSYRAALSCSAHIKEINVLVHHEFGILLFQLRQWELALDHLTKCFHEGRWGKSLYAYLIGICHAVMGDAKKGRDLIEKVPSYNVMKNAPLEVFLADRSAQLLKEPAASFVPVASLLGMEVVYFLNCPQFVPDGVIKASLGGLSEMKSPAFMGLRYLMQGRCMELQEKPDPARAAQSYRDAIKSGGAEHVTAFACYELGVLLSRDRQSAQEGKDLLQKANDSFKTCHFRNRLHVRIHLAKKFFGY